MRHFINHGENGTGFKGHMEHVGLNLRPTELSAVLALSQMACIDGTIAHLNWLCDRLTDNMPPAFTPLPVRPGCYSARYCYAFSVPGGRRDAVVEILNAEGCPAIPMYRPLYELPPFEHFAPFDGCPKARAMAEDFVVFEICAWQYENDLSAVARALEKASKV
jgi:dTDP-4-amino-4,6-dideoxygalactose transaminase